MAVQSIKEKLKKLDKEENQTDKINYKKFLIDYKSVDELKIEADKQKGSNNTESRIKGLSMELALNTGDSKKQKEVLSQIESICKMKIKPQKKKKLISFYLPHLYLIGYMLLSVVCFCFGIFALHYILNKTNNDFFIFLTHLIIYAAAFIPLYIYSYFAPKGNRFMLICTLAENLLMIVLVNEFVSDLLNDFYGDGKKIGSLFVLIFVALIMSIPAIVVGAISFYKYHEK